MSREKLELTYDDYAQSANTLFHFMSKFDYLEDILLRNAIVPRYCKEDLEYLKICNVGASFSEIYVLQKCFCDIPFEPKDIVESEECWLDLEEIYLSLKEKKTIRLNAKVNETESQGMTVNQPKENIEVGTALSLTFVNNITYSLWGIY